MFRVRGYFLYNNTDQSNNVDVCKKGMKYNQHKVTKSKTEK